MKIYPSMKKQITAAWHAKQPISLITLSVAVALLAYPAFGCSTPPVCEEQPDRPGPQFLVKKVDPPEPGKFWIFVNKYETFGSFEGIEDGCACGISWMGEVIESVDAVEFLDAVSGEPVDGFSFSQNPLTTDDLAAADQGAGSWQGFFSEVVQDIAPGIPLKMRFTVTADTETVADVEEDLADNRVGSDEALAGGRLADTHQCIIPTPKCGMFVRLVGSPRFPASGIEIDVRILLEHNGSRRVQVPLYVELHDAEGNVYAAEDFGIVDLRKGQRVIVNNTLHAPADVPDGNYNVVARIERMLGFSKRHQPIVLNRNPDN